MQTTSAKVTTRELIEFLSAPTTYEGHPEVEFIETHISLVFRAGKHVYKLKKPVRFDFLDFSTVALRKVACDAELRLNRRLARSVYLDVVPICRSAEGTLTIGPSEDAEVVDWLVKMRRLDDERTLAYRMRSQNHATKLADIKKVAQTLAEFYVRQAPATVKTDAFCQHLQEHIQDNQEQLAALSTSQDDRDQVNRIHSAQLRFLVTHRGLFESRVLDGRIVNGHGDLRPEHIYIQKSPLVIDCIEFNTDYRTNDVIDELAFLATCCDRLGEEHVGARLFEEYEQASGDHCDPQLIAFYKSYRACVRAKIAGLRSQQQTPHDACCSVEKEHRYLDLASRYVEGLDPPFVLIVGGLMGSGKSTLASELVSLLSAELISSDAVRSTCRDSREHHGTDNARAYGVGKYALTERLANYKQMVEAAKRLSHRNTALIFDGTFTRSAARELVAKFARENGYRVLQVECECPREESIARITERAQRANTTSEARPQYYDQQVAEAEPPIDDLPLVRVDTTLALAAERSAVLAALAKCLRPIEKQGSSP